MQKVLWYASLANGEDITEGKGDFKVIEGALSPWQRLIEYLCDAKTEVTALSLFTKEGHRWNLPSAGKNPRFAEMQFATKPVDFRMFRKAAVEQKHGQQQGGWQDRHTCIEAIYEDGARLQLWVEEETLKSWSIYFTAAQWQQYEDWLESMRGN